MKKQCVDNKQDGHTTAKFQRRIIGATRLRGDLSILVYVMEHDRSLNASTWQIESLKKAIKEIEERLPHRPPKKG
jgi:hypothetical protein